MQHEVAEEGDEDVAEGGGGHDEGEVCPGEGSHVAGEEPYEEEDADDDVGIGEGVEEKGEVVDVGWADLGHAFAEQGVAEGGGEDYCEEDGVLAGGEAVDHGKSNLLR